MDNSRLLRTGEVADLLGVSRQHVVNLCDAFELEHTVSRDGRSRLVSLDSVLEHTMASMGRGGPEWPAPLLAHARLVPALLTDPDALIAPALAALDSDGVPRSRALRETWRLLLEGDATVLAAMMLDTSALGGGLRACTPFPV